LKGLSRHQSRTFLVGSQGVRLTDAQVARFEEQGFLELDRLTSEAEVLALQDV
jgi:hypothetical protein